jgi:hypothetical protein
LGLWRASPNALTASAKHHVWQTKLTQVKRWIQSQTSILGWGVVAGELGTQGEIAEPHHEIQDKLAL